MTRNFGFSNIYLKIGIVLIIASLSMLITAFVFPSTIKYLSGRMAGFCLVSGVVLYIIGRIAQTRRTHAKTQ